MFKSHDKFYSSDGKRTLLIVEDEEINRELLGLALKDDFRIIYAENGSIALEQIEKYREDLSLVLLDLAMPVMSGREVLRRMKEDPLSKSIPVIVLTADKNAELQALKLGASDFITKPFDVPEVILARVQRTIELSEDRQIIIRAYKCECFGYVIDWLNSGMADDAKEKFLRFCELGRGTTDRLLERSRLQ